MYFSYYSSATISNNTITGNSGDGIDCFDCSPTITNNTITGNSGRGIYFYYYSSPWITNNTITGNSGGGIYFYYYSSPWITNNTITGNSASVGGGIFCSESSPTITNNTITGNDASDGGGIYCADYSSPTIANNTIAGNIGSQMGGGIACWDSSSATIVNNAIIGNRVGEYDGGGILCYDSAPTITNNTIAGNSAPTGGGIRSWRSSPAVSNNIVALNSSGIYQSNGSPVLRNNDVYGNTSYNYSGLSAGTGDIATDPSFLNRCVGEYHLRPGSPCIDAGYDPAVITNVPDRDGKQRILGAHVDMGCFEWDTSPYWIRQVGQAKAVPEGFALELRSKPVTAAFAGACSVVELDRSSGLRILSPVTVAVGDVVNMVGQPVLDEGERALQASSLSVGSHDESLVPRPLGLTNGILGGTDYQWAADQGQQGVLGGTGLNNIGLLVTTFGNVNYAGTDYFYVDDGSKLDDGSGHIGVKVSAPGFTIPTSGFVIVTGISSCEKVGSDLIRLLRVRKQADIVPL
ncbi:MAG: right-handed parallel beta-helix repeat-containing protein [Armatimonadetes bacterium]|nr:right-handed parallel beta-helix repeat-containing protein [Armatimonadota bacterium]